MTVIRPFGLSLSTESARNNFNAAASPPPADGIALSVTPNTNHIARISQTSALARACRQAARIVSDGSPVQPYTRLCGLPLERATTVGIIADLMRLASYPLLQRVFFVVDSEKTEQAVTMKSIGSEWLWRVWQEPCRLPRRYATASVGFFCFTILENQFRNLREQRS